MRRKSARVPQQAPNPEGDAERERRLGGLYEKAQTCVAHDRWQEALAHLEQIALVDPEYRNTQALTAKAWHEVRLDQAYNHGVECLSQGDLEGALRYLRRVVDQAPYDSTAQAQLRKAQQQVRLLELYRRGLTYYTEGNWNEDI
jgi:outer membrane protein assembly factor BamD (BamD/ComL family)